MEIGLGKIDSPKKGDSDINHSEMGTRQDISKQKRRTNEKVLTTEIPSRINGRWKYSLASKILLKFYKFHFLELRPFSNQM